MEMLDKVFEILFARMRRKTGDSNLERAWRSASNRVVGYLAFPFGAAAVVLVVVIYAVSGEGTRIAHRHWGQVIAWIAGLLLFLLLNRRFRRYLSTPPILPVAESHADTRLIFWFRAISFGSFVLTCLIGLLLHRAGFRFLQGL
jgi:FtsH-binding integral membrane protein